MTRRADTSDIADFVGLSQNVVCNILRVGISVHENDIPLLKTKMVDHWQVNLCRRIEKIEGATFVVGEEHRNRRFSPNWSSEFDLMRLLS